MATLVATRNSAFYDSRSQRYVFVTPNVLIMHISTGKDDVTSKDAKLGAQNLTFYSRSYSSKSLFRLLKVSNLKNHDAGSLDHHALHGDADGIARPT
jgi:hypothetical protein